MKYAVYIKDTTEYKTVAKYTYIDLYQLITDLQGGDLALYNKDGFVIEVRPYQMKHTEG